MKCPAIVLIAFAFMSCSTDSPVGPLPAGQIVAYVHWDDQPIPGKQVRLVQTGEMKITDTAGRVGFSVRPGEFTIRAYGINLGGPAYLSVDFDVTVRGGDTTFVDIVDCLPCL